MSEDKRLGTNPLDWVAPKKNNEHGDVPFPKEQAATIAPVTANRTETPYVMQGTVFSNPDTLSEEDLMSKGKIKIKQTMETAQAVAHLEDLANSLSSGVIRAENGEESIVIAAADTVKFEMKLGRKKDKAKCSIELEWIDDGTMAEGFKISG